MKNKTLLLIGGSGFFGKSILDYFSRNIYLRKKIKKIIVISRKNINNSVISQIKNNYKFEKINKSILKLKKIPKANYVMYCALLKNFNNDHLALKHYISLAKNFHKQSKILYISSGAVYGKQPINIKKIKESYLSLKKKNTYHGNRNKRQYSILKLKNEKIFKQLENYGIKTSVARCFAFVGRFLPRNSNYVVGNFIENILKNQDISIKSNYNVLRSYMYADDLVRWLIKIVENSKVNSPVYNVGSENTVNIHKFGSILAKKYNLNCPVRKIDEKRYDMYIPSTNKIKKELNLITKFNSLQAVNKTINLLKKNDENKD
jgi:nucleoside-diphosphate-sugar epimerase